MLFSCIANQQNLTSVVSNLYCLIHIHIYDFIFMYSKSAQEMFSLVHIQVTCTKNLTASSVSFQKPLNKFYHNLQWKQRPLIAVEFSGI
jgi:hypothetical protein